MAIVVISTTEHDDYLFYLPIVCKAWEDLGYDVFFYYVGNTDSEKYKVAKKYISNERYAYYELKSIEGIRDETLAQCSRLFASRHFHTNETIITSDVDMIVKKDIFVKQDGIQLYGHDLTNFEQMPMCYIQMNAERWQEVMGIDLSQTLEENMERIIKAEPFHNSDTKYGGWWCTDQEIITKKLKSQFSFNHDRGMKDGLPVGRLDRYGWKMPDEIIDIHLPKDPLNNLDKIIPVTYDWVKEYAYEYMGSKG